MKYFSVAKEIFDWLSRYQIGQSKIKTAIFENKINLKINHPVHGKIYGEIDLPEKQHFIFNDIGFRIEKIDKGQVEIECYDDGGIWDPLDHKVIGTHYATTHFALLGAIIYSVERERSILDKVRSAIDFHIRTSRDEYVFDDWYYHWDFQNYAFFETYLLLKDDLKKDERKRWERHLKASPENTNNGLTNWVAMRTYFSALKYKKFHVLSEKIKFYVRMIRLNRSRLRDGCYDDCKNQSRVIQYHIYTVVLLQRIFKLSGDKKAGEYFLKGIGYFINFIDPDGCFNYLGRGQEQIFGYGLALYALEAAKEIDPSNEKKYQYYIKLLWQYLIRFKGEDHFPLVLNNLEDEKKFGWYDYHHLTVYNAFLGVWLGFTHLLNPAEAETVEPKIRGIIILEPSQIGFLRNENVFAVLFGGLTEYLSEAGLTFIHIWFREIGWFFTCPGGPSEKKFGKKSRVKDIEKNVIAPIARDVEDNWYYPVFRKGRIAKINDNSILVTLNYGPFKVKRKVTLEADRLVVKDNFLFIHPKKYSEFRFMNFPVVIDKFSIAPKSLQKIEFISEKGRLRFDILRSEFQATNFEHLEKIKTAKGIAQIVCLQNKNVQFNMNSQRIFTFSLSRVPNWF